MIAWKSEEREGGDSAREREEKRKDNERERKKER